MFKTIILCLTLVTSLHLQGQEDPFAEKSTTAKTSLDSNSELTLESVAKELKISWPIKDPSQTPEQISQEVKKEISEKLVSNFPKKELAKFKEEVNSKFPTYKIGDTVDISFKYRNGEKQATGVFEKETNTTMNIGRTLVPKVDVKETVLICFDMKKRAAYLQRIGNKKFYDYNAERDILEEKLTALYKSSPFKKAGYIMNEGKWTKPSVIVQAAYDVKQVALQKKQEKKRLEEEKKFKLLHKNKEGEITKILGQKPQHVYIGAGVLVLLILGIAVIKK